MMQSRTWQRRKVTESCRCFEKMDELMGQAIKLKQQLEERGVKVD